MLPEDRGEPGIGERAERNRNRRIWTMMVVLMLSGGVVGFVTALFENEVDGQLPAAWAIAASVIFLLSVGGGSWWYHRMMDELARRDSHFAGSVAMSFYLLVYPVWFLLWKGALVPEPGHLWLFIATYLAMVAGYGWRKWRG